MAIWVAIRHPPASGRASAAMMRPPSLLDWLGRADCAFGTWRRKGATQGGSAESSLM
jgi:hypothetical protein